MLQGVAQRMPPPSAQRRNRFDFLAWLGASRWRVAAAVVLLVALGVGLALNYALGPGTIRYSGTFVATSSMSTARSDATAALLPGGRVLIAGGASGKADTSILASAEIFDSGSRTFAATGSMAAPSFDVGSVALLDGRVLLAGGYQQSGPGAIAPTSMAELYDPVSGTFARTGSMTVGRVHAAMVLLADGRVLVAGGLGQTGNVTSTVRSAEVYDPKTGAFSGTGDMTIAREAATAALLPDGRVLVAGGSVPVDSNNGSVTASAELYDPVSGTFTKTGSMASALEWRSAALLLDGTVLVAGGRGLGDLAGTAAAETYDLATGSFSPTGPMATRRVAPNLVGLVDGRVLVAGGPGAAELYDVDRRSFSTTGTMDAPRSGATATILPNGEVLFAGGVAGADPIASAELYR